MILYGLDNQLFISILITVGFWHEYFQEEDPWESKYSFFLKHPYFLRISRFIITAPFFAAHYIQ